MLACGRHAVRSAQCPAVDSSASAGHCLEASGRCSPRACSTNTPARPGRTGIVFDDRSSVNYWNRIRATTGGRKRGLITEENPARGLYPLLAAGRTCTSCTRDGPAAFPFRAAEDPPRRWIPLNHAIAVNRLLGYSNRVAMTNRAEHSPDEQSNAQIYAFFESFLMKTTARD